MYILIGSVTTATRLKKAAEKIIGFPAYVVHTPSALNQGGCSYSVRVDDRALNEIRKIAGDNEIPIRRIYIERTVNGCIISEREGDTHIQISYRFYLFFPPIRLYPTVIYHN